MNIIKHMEAALLFSMSIVGVASVAVASIPAAQAHPLQASAFVAGNQAIPVVHVSAKRLTPAEKQRLDAEEARGSRA